MSFYFPFGYIFFFFFFGCCFCDSPHCDNHGCVNVTPMFVIEYFISVSLVVVVVVASSIFINNFNLMTMMSISSIRYSS